MVSLPIGLIAWLLNEVSPWNVSSQKTMQQKKKTFHFPFILIKVLSIALIFVFNSSFYFSPWLYYHTPKTLGQIHLEQSKQIYKSVVFGLTSLFAFCTAQAHCLQTKLQTPTAQVKCQIMQKLGISALLCAVPPIIAVLTGGDSRQNPAEHARC